MKNLDPEFRKLPHDPDGEYTVPWLAGTVGIVVNTSKVKEPIGSYGDVFSGKYEGRIVALSDPREWLGWALIHLGLPVNEVTPEVLGRFAKCGVIGCPKSRCLIRTPRPM